MKRRSMLPVCALVAALSLAGCVMNRLDTEPRTIVLREGGGAVLRVAVEPGAEWSSKMQAGPFVFNVLPQFAVWTEDGAGNLVETLYVTGADFIRMRHAAKNEKQAGFYAECLPVWSDRVRASGSALPSKANPYPDAVTSATPGGPATLVTTLTGSTAAAIYLEINKPDDVNATFTEADSGWAGQPSLIYAARLGNGSTRLELVGHGGRPGDEPRIYTDVNGFDTALEQVASIVVTLK